MIFYNSKVGSRNLPKVPAVYCIHDYLSGEMYVGSTNGLQQRLGKHRYAKQKCRSHPIMERGTYEVGWIECADKLERRKLEQMALEAFECVNGMAAYRSPEEAAEIKREYQRKRMEDPVKAARRREYERKRGQTPEYKARKKAYRDRPEVKAAKSEYRKEWLKRKEAAETPEQTEARKEKARQYAREYRRKKREEKLNNQKQK